MTLISRNLLRVGTLVAIFILVFILLSSNITKQRIPEYPIATSTHTSEGEELATERYAAKVNRVDVVFEHWGYTRFRLQTNGLIREGELQSERGFAADPDATVYVLYAQKPLGEQIRYVRLTTEPTFLYVLDSANEIIWGGKLKLQ